MASSRLTYPIVMLKADTASSTPILSMETANNRRRLTSNNPFTALLCQLTIRLNMLSKLLNSNSLSRQGKFIASKLKFRELTTIKFRSTELTIIKFMIR